MARTKHRHTEDEQEDIQGTRIYNAKVEKPVAKYVEALQQRQQWRVDENNLRAKAMEIMEEQGVTEYYLKSGAKVTLVDKGRRIKVESPKDEDGKAERGEKRQVALIEG